MGIRKAAILTTRKGLETLVRAELEIYGYDVTSCGVDIRADEYDLVIVDTDTVKNIQLDSELTVITVSSDYLKSSFIPPYSLCYPVRLSDIDELCTLIGCNTKIYDNSDADSKTEDAVYVINPTEGLILIENNLVKLTKTEFNLLEALCDNRGKSVSRENICSLLGESDGNKADVYICRLRKKLETPAGKRKIVTRRGEGYSTTLILRIKKQ